MQGCAHDVVRECRWGDNRSAPETSRRNVMPNHIPWLEPLRGPAHRDAAGRHGYLSDCSVSTQSLKVSSSYR